MESSIRYAPAFPIPRVKIGRMLLAAAARWRARRTGARETDSANEAARLFDEHADSMFRLAYSYLQNRQDAEDILQDALVQFLRANPRLNDAKHEKAWLLRVTANLSKNRLKSRRVRQHDELDDQLAAEQDPDLAFVWEAVKQLPENQREVIHLFYQEGYSTRETARILDRNESTVRSDLSRGRDNLRGILKEAYDFG